MSNTCSCWNLFLSALPTCKSLLDKSVSFNTRVGRLCPSDNNCKSITSYVTCMVYLMME